MSDMMGEGFGMGNFLWPTVLTGSTAVIVTVLAYVILFPNIKYSTDTETNQEFAIPAASLDPMTIVMRVTRPDERAALEVLRNSGGVCLQKDITYKTGLSKLKTHRIVARLAERGIIQVKRVGKTNEIRVPAWLGTMESTTEPGVTDAS
jgi:predicted transcriptional regulator